MKKSQLFDVSSSEKKWFSSLMGVSLSIFQYYKIGGSLTIVSLCIFKNLVYVKCARIVDLSHSRLVVYWTDCFSALILFMKKNQTKQLCVCIPLSFYRACPECGKNLLKLQRGNSRKGCFGVARQSLNTRGPICRQH